LFQFVPTSSNFIQLHPTSSNFIPIHPQPHPQSHPQSHSSSHPNSHPHAISINPININQIQFNYYTIQKKSHENSFNPIQVNPIQSNVPELPNSTSSVARAFLKQEIIPNQVSLYLISRIYMGLFNLNLYYPFSMALIKSNPILLYA